MRPRALGRNAVMASGTHMKLQRRISIICGWIGKRSAKERDLADIERKLDFVVGLYPQITSKRKKLMDLFEELQLARFNENKEELAQVRALIEKLVEND